MEHALITLAGALSVLLLIYGGYLVLSQLASSEDELATEEESDREEMILERHLDMDA